MGTIYLIALMGLLFGTFDFVSSLQAAEPKVPKAKKAVVTKKAPAIPKKDAEFNSILCDGGTLLTVKTGAGSALPGSFVEKCQFSKDSDDLWQVDRSPSGVPMSTKLTYIDPKDIDPVEIEFKKSPDKQGFQGADLRKRPKRQISCCLKQESEWLRQGNGCGDQVFTGFDDVIAHHERLLSECHAKLSRLLKESQIETKLLALPALPKMNQKSDSLSEMNSKSKPFPEMQPVWENLRQNAKPVLSSEPQTERSTSSVPSDPSTSPKARSTENP